MRFASCGFALLLTATVSAQSPGFEVASIKPGTNSSCGSGSPDRFCRSNASIPDLIGYAYSVQRAQILEGPAWLNAERFDVEAKASSVPTPEQMRSMVRQLLSDRFRLKVRSDRRELSVFALRVARADGRAGAQMKSTPVDCERILSERATADTKTFVGADGKPLCANRMSARPVPNGVVLRFEASGITLPQLATWLSGYAGKVVVDETGLKGAFDLELSFAPGNTPSTSGGVGDDPPVFTAVQEQLGLRLVSTRAPVDVVVVESVERPTVN